MKRFSRTGAGATLTLRLVLAGAWAWAAQPAGVRTHVVLIENMKFSPAAIAVRPGDTVEFRNTDLVPHTATELGAKRFDSGLLERNHAWKWVAGAEGTLRYRCIFHPDMMGTIVVEATPTAKPSPAIAPPGVELCGGP